MIFANLFYWCTNQYVIQRTLGAKNLAEGQKGVLLSRAFSRCMVPFMMMIPGVIAFHLYGSGTGLSIDLAYPRLIRDVPACVLCPDSSWPCSWALCSARSTRC